MTQTTAGVISAINAAADNHSNQAGEFRRLDREATGEVEGLKSTCRGDLMDKLDVVQNAWSEDVQAVAKLIDEMATALHNAANKIQQQDAGSGGGLK
jgi:uncharacterized protein YukE